MIKNWKTSVGGILVALGTGLQALEPPFNQVGVAVGAIGALLLGLSARDSQPKANP